MRKLKSVSKTATVLIRPILRGSTNHAAHSLIYKYDNALEYTENSTHHLCATLIQDQSNPGAECFRAAAEDRKENEQETYAQNRYNRQSQHKSGDTCEKYAIELTV